MNAAHTIEKTVMNLTPGRRRFARVRPRQLPENIGKNRAIVYVYFRSKKCRQTLPLSHGARCELDGFWREGISLGSLLLTHCSRAATRMRRRHQSQRLFTIEPLMLVGIAIHRPIRSFGRHGVKLTTERQRFCPSTDLLLCCRTRTR